MMLVLLKNIRSLAHIARARSHWREPASDA
jgi:hypothetical protein